ncbi:hypothetical protein TNCV_537331 [Trichonephila clavipes]|nr:hypothetical protein TNCV_537331 [Trichonephila clavipes]
MDAPSLQRPMSHYPLHNRIFDPQRSPYLSNLANGDFSFFLKLKNVLKGRHLGTLENIQKSVTDMLKTIPVEDFQSCYQHGNNVSIVV